MSNSIFCEAERKRLWNKYVRGKLCFADFTAPTFLILISFFTISVAFIPSPQMIGNCAGKAASSVRAIIQSPTTVHLISSVFLPAPL